MQTAAATKTSRRAKAPNTSPGPLTVEVRDDATRQFGVKSDYYNLDGDWNAIYVSFTGYFGSYGPELFAAAPETLQALKDLVQFADDNGLEQERGGVSMMLAARAAIAKAEAYR